ncbi:MAG TPA: DUF2878 domain-containing protein [Gammaproteobacteria bacterium]
MKFWISLIGYQVVWFTAVIGAGHGLAWPGLLAMSVYVIWQFSISRQRGADLLLICTALVAGCVLDGALLNTGLLHYQAMSPFDRLPPLWILALWISFALTFTQSLQYLQTRLPVAALLGAIGGPLAYLGAARGWQVVSFVHPLWLDLLWLAVGWGLVTPLLAWLAGYWSRTPAADFIQLRGPLS